MMMQLHITSLSSGTRLHGYITMSAVRPNLTEPVLLQCKRCGRERIYRGKNPYRTNCSWCGTSLSISTCRISEAG
jgi:uncharacterized protein (DUF983 family)